MLFNLFSCRTEEEGGWIQQFSEQRRASAQQEEEVVRCKIVLSAWIQTGARAVSPIHVIMWHLLLVQKEEEDSGPSWETQESMVRKLQKKFPDQDKEVRRHLDVIIVQSDV